KEIVKNATDSLYNLTFDELHMSTALGKVTLKNAIFKADTQVYARMEAVPTAPVNLYNHTTKVLKVRRLGITALLDARRLNIQSISLTDPHIPLTNKYHAYNDTIPAENKPKKSLYESIRDVFSAVDVDRIDIENANFQYTQLTDDESTDFALNNVNIQVEDV